jgi:predicted HTH transcriptional regulator
MNRQQLLERLQDIEWDDFEVKTAQTDVPKDVWETVSAFAKREALVNLLIHTDYFSLMKPRIRVFTNRMLEWKKQTGNDVFFETQIDKTKFTFMIDTTLIHPENNMGNGEESGKKIKTEDKILNLINEDNFISIAQISAMLQINTSAIQKHIENLKSKGIIRRDGADRGGKWVIIKTN